MIEIVRGELYIHGKLVLHSADTGKILETAVSRDLHTIVSTHESGLICIWDDNGELVETHSMNEVLKCVAISNDRHHLAIVCEGSMVDWIYIYEHRAGKWERTYTSHVPEYGYVMTWHEHGPGTEPMALSFQWERKPELRLRKRGGAWKKVA